MPMFDLNTDDPEDSIISFRAGEPGEIGLYRRRGESATVHLQKGEQATLWWRPDRCEDSDAWAENE